MSRSTGPMPPAAPRRQRFELERFEVVRFDVLDFVLRVFDPAVFFGADAAFEPPPLAFVADDFEPEAFEVEVFVFVLVEPLALDDLAVAAFEVVLDDFAAVDRDFAAVDPLLAFEDELAERLRRERREEPFLPSPIGSALPTALTAPPATSPTVPATFPAVRPTRLTTLPASGIGCPPFIRPVTGRSSARSASSVPNR